MRSLTSVVTEASLVEDQGGAEPMVEGRRPRKSSEILERTTRNPPASRAWNGQKVVVGTGESLLGPGVCGPGSVPVYNRLTPGSGGVVERQSEGAVGAPG